MLRRYLIDCFAGKWLTSFGNRIVVGKTWGRNRSVESSLVGEQRSRIGVLCISISAFVDCSLQVLGHRSAMDRIPILSYSPECYRSTSINYLKQVRNGKKGGMREQHKTQEIDATRRFIEADERFERVTTRGVQLMTERLVVYEKEELTLRAMIQVHEPEKHVPTIAEQWDMYARHQQH